MRFLKIPRADAGSVRAELIAQRLTSIEPLLVERLLAPAQPGEPYSIAKQTVEAGLPRDYPAHERAFVVATIARRRAARALILALDAHLATAPHAVEQAFAESYRAMYMESIVPLYDSTLKGDQVIEHIARSLPPGAHGSVMGIQNIKGTGLDFVYRWVSRDMVERSLKKVEEGTQEERDLGLRELLSHDDYGLLDAREALLRLHAAKTRAPAAGYDAVLARLTEIEKRRAAALTARRADTAGDKLRKFIGKTFDYLDSIRRQRMAKDVLEDVVAGRVSHSSAAITMRDIVARAKGAWMNRRA
jgi:hypothetical protein